MGEYPKDVDKRATDRLDKVVNGVLMAIGVLIFWALWYYNILPWSAIKYILTDGV